jgi:NADH:ubiquinone reductase (H+-translocating)
MATNAMRRPKVVIVGAGFAGIYAAQVLAKKDVDLIIVDRRNHHLFQPLLYQVAGAALNPSDIAYPIRSIFRGCPNVEVQLGEVISVDRAAKQVVLEDGALPYDYLIVATGASHSYFGHDSWSAFAPGLKTVEDALEIRRRTLTAFEAAERETDPERRKAWLTFVVVGAGPTGVELAGALAEIARQIVSRDFRHIHPSEFRVLLVEAGPRVLSSFPEALSERARQDLVRLGAEVHLGRAVTGIDALGITLGVERLAARTVLWVAGVAASSLGKSLNVPLDRAGRAVVEPDLSIPGSPEIFVAGDLASVKTSGGELVPGVAPAAMQEGRHAAQQVLRRIHGEATEPFRYWSKGNLATIGRAKAVADLGRIKLSGFVAWWAWLVIHIFYLIGFRNRLLVMTEWAWTYLLFDRGARLITGHVDPLLLSAKPPAP